MDLWRQIATTPGVGGGLVISLITLWLLFLVSLVLSVVRAPREGRRS